MSQWTLETCPEKASTPFYILPLTDTCYFSDFFPNTLVMLAKNNWEGVMGWRVGALLHQKKYQLCVSRTLISFRCVSNQSGLLKIISKSSQNLLACLLNRIGLGLQFSDDKIKSQHTGSVRRNQDRTCPLCFRMLCFCLNTLSPEAYAHMGFCKDLLENISLWIPCPHNDTTSYKNNPTCLHPHILSSSHHEKLWQPQAPSFHCHCFVCEII